MKNILIILIFLPILSCHQVSRIHVIDDLNVGVDMAREKNMSVFIIFDVFGSPIPYVDEVLNDSEVQRLLSSYVVVRLKCDDRRKYNDYLSIGQFNAGLQLKITGEAYQPMFCFLDKYGKKVSNPLGYSSKDEVITYIKGFSTLQ